MICPSFIKIEYCPICDKIAENPNWGMHIHLLEDGFADGPIVLEIIQTEIDTETGEEKEIACKK